MPDKYITQHCTVGVCILIEKIAFFTEKVSTSIFRTSPTSRIELTFAFYKFVIISIIIIIIFSIIEPLLMLFHRGSNPCHHATIVVVFTIHL